MERKAEPVPMKPNITGTLGDILIHATEYPADGQLFMEIGSPWTLLSKCIVVLRDGDRAKAELEGFEYGIGIDAAQQVAANAKAQLPSVSDEQLLECLLFYYDNDAFFEFEPEG